MKCKLSHALLLGSTCSKSFEEGIGIYGFAVSVIF